MNELLLERLFDLYDDWWKRRCYNIEEIKKESFRSTVRQHLLEALNVKHNKKSCSNSILYLLKN